MYRIYSYCSYKQSPAGFQLGYAEVGEQERIHLSVSGINEFVRKSFETGVLKAVHGKIPHTEKYIYILKKLKYTSENEDEFASVVHMNFAFEFESYEEYSRFENGISKMSGEELANLFHEVVIPDISEDIFALVLNGRLLHKAIEHINSEGDSMGEVMKGDIDTTHFLLNSKQTGIEKIAEIYNNITDNVYDLYKINEYEIILKKKKSAMAHKLNHQEKIGQHVTKEMWKTKTAVWGTAIILLLMLVILVGKFLRA